MWNSAFSLKSPRARGSLQLPRELVIKFMFQGLNFFLKFLDDGCGHIKNPAFRGEM